METQREKGEITQVYLFHNHPKPGVIYAPVSQRLLPLDDVWRRDLAAVRWPTKNLPGVMNGGELTLLALVREYLFVSLLRACAESLASENASRLAAMRRAEKNIDELLEELNRAFHRLRQSGVDEELFDVVSGFEALTGEKQASINKIMKEIKMKALENFRLIGISMLLLVGLTACDKPGPAETAGKKIDQAADDAGKKIAGTADKVGEKLSAQGEKMGEQGDKAAVATEDTEITAKVKAAIFAEPGLRTLQISVDTVRGVVTLSGSVDSLANSDRAKALASAVAGVKAVENRLVLKSIK